MRKQPNDIGPGKRVRGSIYVHRSVQGELSIQKAEGLCSAVHAAGHGFEWNVARFDPTGVVGLLTYEDFASTAFPALLRSLRWDPRDGSVLSRDYRTSLNPLILHRKELLVEAGHPKAEHWKMLTKQVEALGLFADHHLIGRRREWTERLKARGFEVAGASIRPITS